MCTSPIGSWIQATRTKSRSIDVGARAWFVCATLACVQQIATANGSELKRPFAIEDSIEWTHVLSLATSGRANSKGSVALFSPDRSHFIIHTRRGDLTKDAVVEKLELFSTDEVIEFLESSSEAAPSPTTLVQLEVRDDSGGLADVQWIDDRQVAYVAEGPRGIPQAYAVELSTGKVSQLTDSPTGVVSVAVAGDTIVFHAHAHSEKLPLVNVLGSRNVMSMIAPPGTVDAPVELFWRTRTTGYLGRIDLPPMRLLQYFRRIWISPSGRYAVTLVPATNAPPEWAQYRVSRYDLYGYGADRVSADAASLELSLRTRYQLIDLKRGTTKPLLNAPSGSIARNGTPMAVYWPGRENSVIVTNTFLPLDVVDENERDKRREAPAIAEVDLETGQIATITFEPMLTDEEYAAGKTEEYRIVAVEWENDREVLKVTRRGRERTGSGEFVEQVQFSRASGAWGVAELGREVPAEPVIEVDIRQDLNQPPRVFARRRGRQKQLFDPNPQAEKVQLAHVERISWTDPATNIRWRGGLVLPRNYARGARYPVVVQTHGFHSGEFLLDGPVSGTAFAAQALAAAGIVVLQIADNRQAMTLDEREGTRVANGWYAAIRQLITDGIADPARVGLIAFSRTGYHLLHLLAAHPDLLVAVSISDSVQPGYMSDVLLTNTSNDVVAQVRSLNGGAPTFDSLCEWFMRNPMYHLNRTTAAVRIEAIGPDSLLGLWETYATLRNGKRPVDLIYYPYGSHVLKKPRERLASQGGSVDWFRFWLQGYEDPKLEKVEQYRRWRALRAQLSK